MNVPVELESRDYYCESCGLMVESVNDLKELGHVYLCDLCYGIEIS